MNYNPISEMYDLVGDDGKRYESHRLHGPGSGWFEMVTPPPSFGVCVLECEICGDPPTHATDCCRKLLCDSCLRSNELAGEEYRRSIALVPGRNPSTCPGCRSLPEPEQESRRIRSQRRRLEPS